MNPDTKLALQLHAETFGTPFYIYDVRELRKEHREFCAAFPHPWFQLYFATMANDRHVVLEELATLGLGACVNSVAHLDLALKHGFPPEKIQYSSTGISPSDMELLLSQDIHVNIDSLQQLEQWKSLGGVTAGLRVNAAELSHDRPKDRIGMSLSDLASARALSNEWGLKISGLHVYIGTNLKSHEQLVPTVTHLFKLAETFPELEFVNLGGGVGVNYHHTGSDFDLHAYGLAVSTCQRQLSRHLGRNINVIVEPGRKMTASCGKLVARITGWKFLHNCRYVSVDASVAIFPRPLFHPGVSHKIWLLPSAPVSDLGAMTEAAVVGQTTFSGDILGVTHLPENLSVGDLLVFDDAGSYSQSMETRFLGQPPPGLIIIDIHGIVHPCNEFKSTTPCTC